MLRPYSAARRHRNRDSNIDHLQEIDVPNTLDGYKDPRVSFPPEDKKFQPSMYKDVDNKAGLVVIKDTTSYHSLVTELLQAVSSDTEKVRTLYSWLGHQDMEKMDYTKVTDSTTPMGYMMLIKSNRGSYACFFALLCRTANIPCVIIDGVIKGVGYEPGSDDIRNLHSSWNAVYVEGYWRFVHTSCAFRIILGYSPGCWRSPESHTKLPKQNGNLKNRWEDFFFFPTASEFIYLCFPDLEQWQLLKNPWSSKTFLDAPHLRESFFTLNFEADSIPSRTIQTQSGNISLTFRCNHKCCPNLLGYLYYDSVWSQEEHTVAAGHNFIMVSNTDYATSINIDIPIKGMFKLEVFAVQKNETIQPAAEFLIRNVEDDKYNYNNRVIMNDSLKKNKDSVIDKTSSGFSNKPSKLPLDPRLDRKTKRSIQDSGRGSLTISTEDRGTQRSIQDSGRASLTISTEDRGSQRSIQDSGRGSLTISTEDRGTQRSIQDSGRASLTISTEDRGSQRSIQDSGRGSLTISTEDRGSQRSIQDSGRGSLTISTEDRVSQRSIQDSGRGSLTISTEDRGSQRSIQDSGRGSLTISTEDRVSQRSIQDSGRGSLTISTEDRGSQRSIQDSGRGSLTISTEDRGTQRSIQDSGRASLTISTEDRGSQRSIQDSGRGSLTISTEDRGSQRSIQDSGRGSLTISTEDRVSQRSIQDSGRGSLTISTEDRGSQRSIQDSGRGSLTISTEDRVSQRSIQDSGRGSLTISTEDRGSQRSIQDSGRGSLTISTADRGSQAISQRSSGAQNQSPLESENQATQHRTAGSANTSPILLPEDVKLANLNTKIEYIETSVRQCEAAGLEDCGDLAKAKDLLEILYKKAEEQKNLQKLRQKLKEKTSLCVDDISPTTLKTRDRVPTNCDSTPPQATPRTKTTAHKELKKTLDKYEDEFDSYSDDFESNSDDSDSYSDDFDSFSDDADYSDDCQLPKVEEFLRYRLVKKVLRLIHRVNNPVLNVKTLMKGVLLLLGYSENDMKEWIYLQTILRNADVHKQMQNLKISDIPSNTVDKVKAIMKGITRHKIYIADRDLTVLFDWLQWVLRAVKKR